MAGARRDPGAGAWPMVRAMRRPLDARARSLHPRGRIGTNSEVKAIDPKERVVTRTRLIALLAAALLLVFAPAASAQSDTGSVTVVHGVPDTPVDVYVNGDATLEGFEPGTITDPLELPAGSYDVEIYPAGANVDNEDPVIAGSADLEAGANVSLVAHLDADGNPTLGVFPNDTSQLPAGEGRITVRHAAAAPAVDILANGDAVFTGVENGQEGSAELPAGTISAAVALAGETDPVLGPVDVDVAEGVNTIVYAIGSAEEGTLDVLVQTITGLNGSPSSVESGTGGLKAAEQQSATMTAWLAAAGLLTLAGGGAVAARRATVRARR